MIQAILAYQFVLNQGVSGEIEPEFMPLQLVFKNDKFNRNDYSELIDLNDIFAIFYQHTTGIIEGSGSYSNFYTGRLKETPYKIISFFKQETDGSQFIIISIFELDDEIGIFDDLIKGLMINLENTFQELIRAKASKQLGLVEKANNRIVDDIKFGIFQIERLSTLDKLQKSALIFNSEERLIILRTLREYPMSKRRIKQVLEAIKINPNIDLLIEPFLELNLIRRDWIKGERDKKTGKVINQGEYLFLTKDLVLARIPNEAILKKLRESGSKEDVIKYKNYKNNVIRFFSNYDPLKTPIEETKKLASLLLNPDTFDFFILMRNNYYPLDKIPKILSNWANVDLILEEMKSLNVITEVKDDKGKSWVILLTDLKPLIIFPEYILPKIKQAFDHKIITKEIAKKAYDLLEVTYPEQVKF